MNTWCPLFSKIVDSSVWTEALHVRVVFVTMLALKDADHCCRYNAFALGRRANIPEKDVIDALRVLSSPDKSRLEPQPFDGRRIEKTQDGWLILNGELYHKMMQQVNRKQSRAKWMRDHRIKSKPLPGETAYVRGVENGTIDPATGNPIQSANGQ
jgi:hypothetical protein